MKYEQLLVQGHSPARHKQAQKFAIKNTTPVFEFGERHFKEIVQRDRKHPSGIRAYLDNDIYPRFADRPVKDITSADVQSLVFRKRDGGHPASRGQLRSLPKRMFDYAVANGLVQVNPVASLPMRFVTQARSRDRALSATAQYSDQRRQMLQHWTDYVENLATEAQGDHWQFHERNLRSPFCRWLPWRRTVVAKVGGRLTHDSLVGNRDSLVPTPTFRADCISH